MSRGYLQGFGGTQVASVVISELRLGRFLCRLVQFENNVALAGTDVSKNVKRIIS